MTAPGAQTPDHRRHPCPHCRCTHPDTIDMGYVDKDAPFYPLVELVMETTR